MAVLLHTSNVWSCALSHEKRPGESCARRNQWFLVAAHLCCFLMDRHNGNNYLYPGLNRLGISHLASILPACASANTEQVCHICCMDVCFSLVRCFKFRRVIQRSNPDNTNQCHIPNHNLCMHCGCIVGIGSPILFPWAFVHLLPGTQFQWYSLSHKLTCWQETSFSPFSIPHLLLLRETYIYSVSVTVNIE